MSATAATVSATSAIVSDLAESVSHLSESVSQLKDIQNQMLVQMEENQQEVREAINNLIIANAVTRDLAQNVAKLAIATSHR